MDTIILMVIWTIVTLAPPYSGVHSSNAVGVSQTSTMVPKSVCEEMRKMPSSAVKTAQGENQKVTITVKCIAP